MEIYAITYIGKIYVITYNANAPRPLFEMHGLATHHRQRDRDCRIAGGAVPTQALADFGAIANAIKNMRTAAVGDSRSRVPACLDAAVLAD